MSNTTPDSMPHSSSLLKISLKTATASSVDVPLRLASMSLESDCEPAADADVSPPSSACLLSIFNIVFAKTRSWERCRKTSNCSMTFSVSGLPMSACFARTQLDANADVWMFLQTASLFFICCAARSGKAVTCSAVTGCVKSGGAARPEPDGSSSARRTISEPDRS